LEYNVGGLTLLPVAYVLAVLKAVLCAKLEDWVAIARRSAILEVLLSAILNGM